MSLKPKKPKLHGLISQIRYLKFEERQMATYFNSNYSNFTYNYNHIRTWEERQMATYLSVAIADIERDDMITNTAWIDYLIFLFHPFIIVYYYQYLLLSYIYNESDEMVTNRLDFIFILTLFSFY